MSVFPVVRPATLVIIILLARSGTVSPNCTLSSTPAPPQSPENKQFECTDLFDFPEGKGRIDALRARNNGLIKISAGELREKRLASLEALVLGRGRIRIVEEGAFAGLDSLILLDLDGNRLEEFAMGTFEGAAELRVLILSRNRIGRIIVGSGQISNLVFLDLSSNAVSGVPEGFSRALPALKYLDLSGNPLGSVAGSVLSSDSLEILRLSNCGLERLSEEDFRDLPELQVLDLTGNKLKTWPVRFPHLRILRIDKVPLEEAVPPLKMSQSPLDFRSDLLVEEVLANVNDLANGNKELNLLEFVGGGENETANDDKVNWEIVLKKCWLFTLLVYLSFIYTLLLSQVFKSIISKPYQRVAEDEEVS